MVEIPLNQGHNQSCQCSISTETQILHRHLKSQAGRLTEKDQLIKLQYPAAIGCLRCLPYTSDRLSISASIVNSNSKHLLKLSHSVILDFNQFNNAYYTVRQCLLTVLNKTLQRIKCYGQFSSLFKMSCVKLIQQVICKIVVNEIVNFLFDFIRELQKPRTHL